MSEESDDNQHFGLSEENYHKLLQFQEISGIENPEEAKEHLSMQNWDVATAVQHFLSISEIQSEPGPSNENGEVRRRKQSSHSTNGENAEQPSSNSAPTPTAGPLVSTLTWGFHFMTMPFQFVYKSLASLLIFVYRLVIPHSRRLTDPRQDVLEFIDEFESSYGPSHPGFFQGSYSQALSHAKTELKFLLIYLHCSMHQDTTQFCSSTLRDPDLIEYIDNNMLMWGCSVTSAEGYRVSQALRENSYPFLAVVVLKDNKMTVVARLEGPYSPGALMVKLQEIMRDNESYLVVARTDRAERAQTAALREEQDQAYMESLLADKEKARRKKEEEEELKKAVDEKEAEMEAGKKYKEYIDQCKIDYLQRIPEEPKEDPSESVVQVVIKFPSGKRLTRKFHAVESMKSLYYYIFCQPDTPDRFEVTTNFPRLKVPCEPKENGPDPPSFQAYKLPQKSMLFVTDLDA